jgi:hypothetical protein
MNLKNIVTDLGALLGTGKAAPPDASELARFQAIRESMLDMMGEDVRRRFPDVASDVRYARDAMTLWYLRPRVLQAMAWSCGEIEAERRVLALNEQFEGLVPVSRRPRH